MHFHHAVLIHHPLVPTVKLPPAKPSPQLTGAQAELPGVPALAGLDADAYFRTAVPPQGQVTTVKVKLALLKSQSLRRSKESGQRSEAIYQSMLKLDDFACNTLLMGPLLMVVRDRGTALKRSSAVRITDLSLEAASFCSLNLKLYV